MTSLISSNKSYSKSNKSHPISLKLYYNTYKSLKISYHVFNKVKMLLTYNLILKTFYPSIGDTNNLKTKLLIIPKIISYKIYSTHWIKTFNKKISVINVFKI